MNEGSRHGSATHEESDERRKDFREAIFAKPTRGRRRTIKLDLDSRAPILAVC